jgi:hypothetical protein
MRCAYCTSHHQCTAGAVLPIENGTRTGTTMPSEGPWHLLARAHSKRPPVSAACSPASILSCFQRWLGPRHAAANALQTNGNTRRLQQQYAVPCLLQMRYHSSQRNIIDVDKGKVAAQIDSEAMHIARRLGASTPLAVHINR